MIKFLIGGSSCAKWSTAQRNNRETTAEGIGWELFLNYLIAKEKFKPDYFLYENNKTAAPAIKNQIFHELGVPLQDIDSKLVSAQHRGRFYCHNFGNVPQPEDRKIFLDDILEHDVSISEMFVPFVEKKLGQIVDKYGYLPQKFNPYNNAEIKGKSPTVTANISRQTASSTVFIIEPANSKTKQPIYEVEGGFIAIKEKKYPVNLPDGAYAIRRLTVTECCRLQTLPDDYCRAVSMTQAYIGLGNGWTAEVIIHLLFHAMRDVPKNEEIVVLSMYDGIGTGRYCFDKLGYHNIKYYAYEIDKCAIKVATSNYSDIIQCGDAFQVRVAENIPPSNYKAVK